MCKKYKKGECKNKQCGFAHEGDVYEHVAPFTKLKGNGSTMSSSDMNVMGLSKDRKEVRAKDQAKAAIDSANETSGED